jgi:hypothetical protein
MKSKFYNSIIKDRGRAAKKRNNSDERFYRKSNP